MELNPMNQINPAVIVAVMVIFAASYLVLRKTFFLPIIEVMERRRARFEQAEAANTETRAILAEAEGKAEVLIAKAKDDANVVSTAVQESNERAREVTIAAARERSEAILARGRGKILAERGAEQARLRDEAIDCVALACTKVIGEVQPEVIESTVDRLMARKVQ